LELGGAWYYYNSRRSSAHKQTTKGIEDQTLKDLKAKNYIFQAIARSILETILNKDTTKHIWDSLK
jgi:hypothetical protein